MTGISDEFQSGATISGLPDTRHGLHVFVDGCHQPVSGHGGWAFVACHDGAEIACGLGGVERSTNNAMEVMAVLQAVVWINATMAGIPALIWSDSVHAVEGCNRWRSIWRNNGWKKSNPGGWGRNRSIPDADLWKEVDLRLSENPSIGIAWCKGHSGIAGNERADALSDQGRRSIRRR